MIHIAGHDGPGYKDGDVIESFDAPQGHGMAVDQQGFLYLGQNTVRKYDKTGKMLMAVPHIPENANGQPFTMPTIPTRTPGLGSDGPVASIHHRSGHRYRWWWPRRARRPRRRW